MASWMRVKHELTDPSGDPVGRYVDLGKASRVEVHSGGATDFTRIAVWLPGDTDPWLSTEYFDSYADASQALKSLLRGFTVGELAAGAN